jgi:hypothetical protein
VITATVQAGETTMADFVRSIQPAPMALALAKSWALDALGGEAGRARTPTAIVEQIDEHARALGEAFQAKHAAIPTAGAKGSGGGGGVRRGSGGARARALASEQLDELARLLYGARRSAALSPLLQHTDDIAAAGVALAGADVRLGLRLIEPQMLAVAAVADASGGWSLEYTHTLAPCDLALRSSRVVVVDHGNEIAIWWVAARSHVCLPQRCTRVAHTVQLEPCVPRLEVALLSHALSLSLFLLGCVVSAPLPLRPRALH